jgi:hypothetical protein
MTDVEKLCWFCRHFWYSNASPGYSELTPGDDFSMTCGEQYWSFDAYRTTQEEFGAMLAMAATCPDFSVKE